MFKKAFNDQNLIKHNSINIKNKTKKVTQGITNDKILSARQLEKNIRIT